MAKLWTIYQEDGGLFHARLRVADAQGTRISGDVMVSESVEQIREAMRRSGFTLLTERIDVDPRVIEVWT